MAADRYKVTALAKRGLKLSLRVEAMHGDVPAPSATEAFALTLIHERGAPPALLREVAPEDLADDYWLEEYAHGFVSDVRAVDQVGGAKPRATLEITTTHDAWTSHIEKGDAWLSRAIQLVGECDDCEPFAPPDGDTTLVTAFDDPDLADAFLYLPRSVWGGSLPAGEAPDLLEIPAYSPSAYGVVDKIAKPRAIPADWLGRAVRAHAWSSPEDGALVGIGPGGAARWATMSRGSYGTGEGKLDSIGRLALRAGRRGTKLTYSKILGRLRAERIEMTMAGPIVVVKFRVPPGPFAIAFEDAGGVLDYLAAGIPDGDAAPLRRALATNIVAERYIAKFAIDALPTKDLDTMAPDDVKVQLTAAWPIVSLRVTVTDPKWIAHLDDHPPPSLLLLHRAPGT